MHKQEKILLALLNSNGDCLFGTIIARQIKENDHPGSHLTWAINKQSRQTIFNSPHVDAVWEVPTKTAVADPEDWEHFVKTAEEKKATGEFDHIYCLQIIGRNTINLSGLVRHSIYLNYGRHVTVPHQPIVVLTEEEKTRVREFAERHNLSGFRNVVLVECGPQSFRSALNRESALAFSREISKKHPGTAFILSSREQIDSKDSYVIDGSVLTFRENAALTAYCNFFIGCSSGISWLCTSTAAKKIPMVLVLNNHSVLNTSMVRDHEEAGLPTNHLIELSGKEPMIQLRDCFLDILSNGFDSAREKHHAPFRHTNYRHLYYAARQGLREGRFLFPVKAFKKVIRKDGISANAVMNLGKAYAKLPGIWITRLRKGISGNFPRRHKD